MTFETWPIATNRIGPGQIPGRLLKTETLALQSYVRHDRVLVVLQRLLEGSLLHCEHGGRNRAGK